MKGSISDIAAMYSAQFPVMFCSQKCAHYVYYIHVLQPKGSSPTRIFEGLVSEHFLYSEHSISPTSLPGNQLSLYHTCKATLSRSGFPILFLTGIPSPLHQWFPVNLYIPAHQDAEGDTHIPALQAAITLCCYARATPRASDIIMTLKTPPTMCAS